MKSKHKGTAIQAKTFTLAKKIGLVLFVICVGFVGIIGLVRYMIDQVSHIDEEMSGYQQLMLDAQQIQIWMLEVRKEEKSFLLERDLSHKKTADMDIVKITQSLARIDKLPQSGGVAAHSKQIKDLSFEYALAFNNIASGDLTGTFAKEDLDELNRTSTAIEDEVSQILAEMSSQVDAGLAHRDSVFQQTGWWIISLSAFIALLSVLLTFGLFRRSILTPLRTLLSAIDKMAAGDFTVNIQRKPKRYVDEIDQALDKFTQMKDGLADILRKIHDFSGDVSQSSNQLLLQSNQVGRAAEEIAESSMAISQSMNDQAESVRSNVERTEQLAQQIEEVEQNISFASDASQKMLQVATVGKEQVGELVEQMDAITHAITQMDRTVGDLSGDIQQVGGIVQLVTSISDQTKLLSLNASIEAARVGEHGKGFAVVANEVKKLAEQTKCSADQITELISQIQQGSSKILDQMKASKQVVEQGTQKVQSSGSHFRNIGDRMHEVARRMAEADLYVKKILDHGIEAARSSVQMQEAITTMNAGVESISAATEQQCASTEEVNASLALLSQDANQLKKLVNQFTLNT